MSFEIPQTILIKSDDNVIEYTKTIKEKTGDKYQYTYTKSFSNLGTSISFSEVELVKYLLNNVFKII